MKEASVYAVLWFGRVVEIRGRAWRAKGEGKLVASFDEALEGIRWPLCAGALIGPDCAIPGVAWAE